MEEQKEHNVAGLTLSDWTKKFWEWIYQLTDESSPISVVGPARPWRFAGRQPTEFQMDRQSKFGESVWFVAPAPYAEPNSVVQLNIPVGNWWILVAPATSAAAYEYFPSIRTEGKLKDFVLKDIAKTYELWTIWDGFSVDWHYVNNTDKVIQIKDIPNNKSKTNIIHRGPNTNSTITTMQAGYWNYFGPVKAGDHLLTIHSRSPIYRVDITYQVSAVGPPTRTRVYDGHHVVCSACYQRLAKDSAEIITKGAFQYHLGCQFKNSRIRYSNHCRRAEKSKAFMRY